MKDSGHWLKAIGWLSIFIAVLVFSHMVPPTHAANAKRPSSARNTGQQFVAIDFNDVDLHVFIKFISELTGKNFVIDQRVKGKVTIISPSKISLAETYKVFESVLEVHGYTTVEAGQVTKIIPSPDARTKNIETRFSETAVGPEDKVITQLIALKYADPAEIKQLFAPFVSKNSVIQAYQPTSMLIVTDVKSNIHRLMRILGVIDTSGIGHEVSIFPVEHASAKELVEILKTVLDSKKKAAKGASVKTLRLIADERTNTIVTLSSKADAERIKQMILLLDKETPTGQGTFHVYYLKNATAEDLAKVLQELPSKEGKAEKGKQPFLSKEIKINADKATNSLVIIAEKSDYLILEDIIKKLDIPRSMVYIEGLIMEVNADYEFKLGTEWQVFGEVDVNGKQGVVGGGFSGIDQFNNIGSIASGTLPAGVSVGAFSEFIEINGVKFPNLAAVITAFDKNKDINIISTPQLLTTDNQEAKIFAGQNVPFQTTATTSNNDTFNSFEYRDVGVTLQLTPHISQNRLVRLEIFEEISKVEPTDEFRPTTLNRQISTTVIARDNSTIVIGGLIDETYNETINKGPLLGDIPLLGWLFKSKSTKRERTNLYLFLTPRVIQSDGDAQALLDDTREEIDKMEMEELQKRKDEIEERMDRRRKSMEEGTIKMYDENAETPEPLSILNSPDDEAM